MKRAWTMAALVALLLAGCAQAPKLTNRTFVLELGTDVYANPSLYIDNADSINVSRLKIMPQSPGLALVDNRFVSSTLDYLGVGTYDFVMSQDGGGEQPFVIKIKDTQPPAVSSAPDSIEVPWQSTIRWEDYIQADDLSGVYIDAPSGVSDTPGDHTVDVRVRDRFGNSTTRQIQVTVK